MIRYVKEKDAALLDKQRSRLLQTREHEVSQSGLTLLGMSSYFMVQLYRSAYSTS